MFEANYNEAGIGRSRVSSCSSFSVVLANARCRFIRKLGVLDNVRGKIAGSVPRRF